METKEKKEKRSEGQPIEAAPIAWIACQKPKEERTLLSRDERED